MSVQCVETILLLSDDASWRLVWHSLTHSLAPRRLCRLDTGREFGSIQRFPRG
jgi:hypothetical protein